LSVWKESEFVSANAIIEQGQKVTGILAANKEDYKNNDIYFIVTRHESPVLLHQGVEVHDTNVKFEIPLKGDENMNPVGFHKGRRFSLHWLTEKP